MMKSKKAIIMLLILTCIVIICGCDKQRHSVEENLQNEVDISLNNKNLENTLYTIIRDQKDTGSAYLVEGFMISPEDSYNALEIEEKYISNNAIYIKIDTNGKKYMYRFQLNTKGLIKSYIKYELEA